MRILRLAVVALCLCACKSSTSPGSCGLDSLNIADPGQPLQCWANVAGTIRVRVQNQLPETLYFWRWWYNHKAGPTAPDTIVPMSTVQCYAFTGFVWVQLGAGIRGSAADTGTAAFGPRVDPGWQLVARDTLGVHHFTFTPATVDSTSCLAGIRR